VPGQSGELCELRRLSTVIAVADSGLQQQLNEVRALLVRARELFGANPVEPPTNIAPDRDAVQTWIR